MTPPTPVCQGCRSGGLRRFWFVVLFYLSPGGRRAVDFLPRRDCSLPPAIKCRGLFVEGTSGGHEGRMRSKGLVSYGVWLRGLGA